VSDCGLSIAERTDDVIAKSSCIELFQNNPSNWTIKCEVDAYPNYSAYDPEPEGYPNLFGNRNFEITPILEHKERGEQIDE